VGVPSSEDDFELDHEGIYSGDIWDAPPSKANVPQRSYTFEFVVTILVPMVVLILLVILLSFILCFHHEGM
jgi:Sarcoglycan alpha/epsilon